MLEVNSERDCDLITKAKLQADHCVAVKQEERAGRIIERKCLSTDAHRLKIKEPELLSKISELLN